MPTWIRGRTFDRRRKYLPDGLTLVDSFITLDEDEKRFVSQVQGPTYANIFGLVERFINAKVLELSRDHWLGDQTALEALVRFSDEELKHQELFRRISGMIAATLPAGYRFDVDTNGVARVVLGKSDLAVLALTLDVELFTQVHYRESIEPDAALSKLFKDVFLYHWREEGRASTPSSTRWNGSAVMPPSPTSATTSSMSSSSSSARSTESSRRRLRPIHPTSSPM